LTWSAVASRDPNRAAAVLGGTAKQTARGGRSPSAGAIKDGAISCRLAGSPAGDAQQSTVPVAGFEPQTLILPYAADISSKQKESEMTIDEIADQLIKLCREGKFHEAVDSLYGEDVVSMEAGAPPGGSRESKGLEAVKAKGEWWIANHEVHSIQVEGPLLAVAHFAVTFKLEVSFKPQNRRFQMEEVAVYKVADGKIVYEEFFYAV
jgi:hypothetical protein